MSGARIAPKQRKNDAAPLKTIETLRLTFVMPTYNREKTVGSALEQLSLQIKNSKYSQQFTILISENKSTDRTAEIVNSYAAQHEFIRVISPSEHLPSGEHNLFFALKHVDADFVWSFADDDLMLPGTVDWIYERLLGNPADFILINSQYQDTNGQVLRDHILDMNESSIHYDSFADIFCAVGPLTLLASFSSAIYRPQNMTALDLDSYLSPCAIYAHVFAYLEAFSNSRVEIISAPFVVLRRSTATAHWETVAQRYNWYLYYPWTGSLVHHLLRAKSRNAIRSDQYGFALNSNENGRYGLIANVLVQFVLQLLRALETGEPRELPSATEFAKMRAIVQDLPFIAIDTLDFLMWGEKNFGDLCALLAPPGSELQHSPSKMANAIHSLGLDDSIDGWLNEVRKRLVDKLHEVKSLYVNFGTTAASADAKPFTFMAGSKYVIFRLGIQFVVMSREVYDQDWHAMLPNCLDPQSHAPDWYVFDTFDEALKRYTQLDQHVVDSVGAVERSNQVLIDAISTAPWNTLRDVISTGDVHAFLDGVAKSPSLHEVRQALALILGCPEPNECNVFSTDTARHGFINPIWYKNTYMARTQGLEREIIQHSPLVHYVLLGSRKGWCLSPFVDEFMAKDAPQPEQSAEETSPLLTSTGLGRYFSSKDICEISDYFSVPYYLAQCESKGVSIDLAPPVHFLAAGIQLGLHPHPNWDENAYLNNNSDVKQSSDAPCLGWLHWCTHGRFEKRPSGFSKRGVK
jgi:glycosyltransferase involved in cell wall biosynthesis